MTGSWYPDKFCMCLLVDVSFSACDEAVISYQMIRTRRCNMEGRHLNTQYKRRHLVVLSLFQILAGTRVIFQLREFQTLADTQSLSA